MRRELHQQEALAEVFAARPAVGQARTRLDVVLPYPLARLRELQRVHAIFDDGGRSGASQYAAADGIHVYSSVSPDAVARVRHALDAARLSYTASPSRFVRVDAPRCARLAARS